MGVRTLNKGSSPGVPLPQASGFFKVAAKLAAISSIDRPGFKFVGAARPPSVFASAESFCALVGGSSNAGSFLVSGTNAAVGVMTSHTHVSVVLHLSPRKV